MLHLLGFSGLCSLVVMRVPFTFGSYDPARSAPVMAAMRSVAMAEAKRDQGGAVPVMVVAFVAANVMAANMNRCWARRVVVRTMVTKVMAIIVMMFVSMVFVGIVVVVACTDRETLYPAACYCHDPT